MMVDARGITRSRVQEKLKKNSPVVIEVNAANIGPAFQVGQEATKKKILIASSV